MKTLIRLRSLIVPLMIVSVLAAVAGCYYLIWSPSEDRYLDSRNFRLLTTLSDQISASINNFDSMMDNAAESGVTESRLDDYLKIVAPQMERVQVDNRDAKTDDFGDPPRMAVRADEGSHFLYFDFKRTDEKTHLVTQYATRTDLEKLIRKILPPGNRNPFDVVLVAQSDGTVIFQNSASGISLMRINALEDAAAPPKGDKREDESNSPSESDKFSFSKFRQINLAGDRFRLYSQPIRITLPRMDPTKENALPEQWVLCGLVRVATFRAESQSIATTYILWSSALILLLLSAYPFLKLRISSPAERMRPIDLVVTAVLTCVATTTLTFTLLDVYYNRETFGREESIDPMMAIAHAINKNFEKERQDALKQLNEFHVTMPSVSAKGQPTFNRDGGCDPASACQISILAKPEVRWTYPYLEFAAWNNSDGLQQIKWSTKRHVTPFIKLDDPTVPYYPAVKKALIYNTPNEVLAAARDGVGNQFSPNTGDYITLFWQVSEGKEGNGAFSASIVTRPVSVVNPILPAEFGFAIIRHDGMVVYHSDPTRNLQENFFAETDQDQELKSRVYARAEGDFVTKYMGRRHRLYVYPMTADATKSWTVVVFRDLRLEETMNLEVVSLASILFVLYALITVVALLVLYATGAGHATGSWLWPDSRKTATYGRLAAVNSGGVILLLVLPQLPGVMALLLFAVGIPLGTLILNVLGLRRKFGSTHAEDTSRPRTNRWQFKYFSTLCSLLAVVAALPCLSFFKVAWDFEQRILIERSQLRLAFDLDDRAERLRARYINVRLGPDAKEKIFAEPDKDRDQYFSYHNSFLNTSIALGDVTPQSTGQDTTVCMIGSACAQQNLLVAFLSWTSPLYNEIAYDGRFQTLATQKLPIWSSLPTQGREELTLIRPNPTKRNQMITSYWTPMYVPWGDSKWWVGIFVCSLSLFLLVRFSLRRIFLLDLKAPDRKRGGSCLPEELSPKDLIAKLSLNMVIVGRSSSPIIAGLIERKDVQVHDLFEKLASTKPLGRGNGSVASNKALKIVEDVKNSSARKVLFYNFEHGLADPTVYQLMVSVVERVLALPCITIAIVSAIDPCSKLTGEDREFWQKLSQAFVRINVNEALPKSGDETIEDFEARISEDGYNNWLFDARSEAQKLILVQLAEEGLVNPNNRAEVRDLMSEGLLTREHGMLAIRDRSFLQFVKKIASGNSIQDLESHMAVHSNTLRISLLTAGTAAMVFLFFTQGAVVNTWITYATGLAAAIPALIKLFEQMGSRSASAS